MRFFFLDEAPDCQEGSWTPPKELQHHVKALRFGADETFFLVLPDGSDGEAYVVYRNYAAIMAYNCAHLYAVTVGTLADNIGSVK